MPEFTGDVRARTCFLFCCGIALLAKLYCAATTFGTNDTGLFAIYAEALYDAGLETTYATSQHFNHTPLLSSALMVLHFTAKMFGLSFPLLLRLPGILADLVTSLMLWRLLERHLPKRLNPAWCSLFALNPLSLMVSGYHGNFDSLLAMFLFLAAYHCITGRVEISALFFALAINVKIAPIILSPVFFFFWMARWQGGRFFILTTSLVLATWLIPLLQYPRLFFHNVLGYGSYWGVWGLTYWLRTTGYPPFHLVSFYGLAPIQEQIMLGLKLFVGAGILLIARRQAKAPATEIFTTLSIAWALFFTFAPGVLLHYLVWPSCFILLCSPRWYLGILTSSSVFVFISYTVVNGRLPWNAGIFRVEVLETWLPWSILPWLTFAAFFIALLTAKKTGHEILPVHVPMDADLKKGLELPLSNH
ncbi:MAG: rane protein [Chthoniobacteraceae bacterium]|nr:rane protein [Chthoniobacteraceae bacterium]